jgi:putative transposase
MAPPDLQGRPDSRARAQPSGTQGPGGGNGDRGADGEDGPSLTPGQARDLVRTAVDAQLAPALDMLLEGTRACSDLELDDDRFEWVVAFAHSLVPGEEAEICRIDPTGPNPIFMRWSDMRLSKGSHHGIYMGNQCCYRFRRSTRWRKLLGTSKGKSAIHIARTFMERKRNFVGQHFWARGYFVSTVGRDEELIRRYIRHQEVEDKRIDQLRLV